MNTLQKTAGVALSLSLLCGMQAYTFPDYPPLGGQIIEQSDTCQGVVKGASGENIIGVSVPVEGTTNGSITGLDDDFSLGNVEKGDIIVVSCVGYQSQEIAWTGESLNIILRGDAEVLDKVVVTGYGTVRKTDMVGSVAVLDNKNFKDQPITQVVDALQGRVSGVHVENNGIPGGSMRIRIHGANSISKNSDPLYVVDGVARESGLGGINPEDIRSMQVLKDVSSVTIYGSRGSNEVVLITTEIGEAGMREIALDAPAGISNIYKRYDILGIYDYTLALKGVKGIDFSNKETQSYRNGTGGIDWQDEIFHTGITQDYRLAPSNGNEKAQYYISANHMNQEGVVIESRNERYQAKTGLSSQPIDWLHITADINISHGARRGGSFAPGKDNPIWIALNYSPTMTTIAENRNYNTDTCNSITPNPIGILRLQSGETMTNVFNGRVDSRPNIIKGLTFTVTNGVDYYGGRSYSFNSKWVEAKSGVGNNDTYRLMLQSSNNLAYTGSQNDHHLTATAVYEVTSPETRIVGITGNNLLTEGVGRWSAGTASSRDTNNGYEQWALMSGVACVTYSFKDRYVLIEIFYADGSSRFAEKKWGYFPSTIVAWTLSNEGFMKDVSLVQDIKLRTSYGIVGNQTISPYTAMGPMSATAYNFGTSSNFTSYWANDITTSELTWEETKQLDLGLEFSLFGRRLNFSADYLYKHTTDVLFRRSIPGYVGSNSFQVNDDEISNRGVNLSMAARTMQSDQFRWASTLNDTYLKNRVERLSDGENDSINGFNPVAGMVDHVTIIKLDETIGTFWGYEWTGLDENGHDTHTDVDENQTIDGGDHRVIGKANPNFILGWNNSLSYKNWDLNLFFSGSFGAERLNLVRYAMASTEGSSRFVTLTDVHLKGFDKTGSSVAYPSLAEGGNSPQPVPTKWLGDVDFFRLENISLPCTFSKKTTGFANLRLTFSCQNLFTIIEYEGVDSAGTTFSSSSVDVGAGIDMGTYPSPRIFTFGLRMNF